MVSEGNAESPDGAFSGIAWMMLDQFRKLGLSITTIDAELYGWRRGLVAARTVSRRRSAWRARFHVGPEAFRARSLRAATIFEPFAATTDVVYQIGAALQPPGGTIPYVLYCDWNMRLTIRHANDEASEARYLSVSEAEEADSREAAIYRGAAAVFTISERLRKSFLEDYGLLPGQVVTAHPGANLDVANIPQRPASRPDGQPPTILFSGKEAQFQRKGGDVLLSAFREVRRAVPDARLLLMGPSCLGTLDPGVEVLGLLHKSDPVEYERFMRAFLTSDVFCLPSRYDPFPTVVREAMFFSLPCVTSDIWAMPEMVLDGITGYTVPVGEAGALAERLIALLRDPALARRMGETGRRHAELHFTWPAAAARMHERLQTIVARR